ncbi:MAG: tetratricopeptide repeat protein [Bryobacteraceae bacterium]
MLFLFPTTTPRRPILIPLVVALALSPAFAQAPADPESTLRRASEFQQAGDSAKAIPLYREYLKTHPSSPGVLSNLGAALAHEGRYAEAIAEYTKSLAIEPGNPQSLANLGLAYYKTGQVPQAREKLQAALGAMPGNQQLNFLVADCDVRLGEYKAAIAILEPLEKSLVDNDTFDYLLGTALLRDNQVESGGILIDRILRRGDSAQARLLMGTAKLDVRDYLGAREDFEKALALNPKLPEAHAYLGLALARVSDVEKATAEFRADLALDPNSFLPTFELGVLAAKEQRNAEARKLFTRSLSLRPGDPSVRYQLATLDLAEGQVEKARIALEAIVKQSPDFTAAHVNLATVYYRLKRKEDGDRERVIVRKLNAASQAAEPGVSPSGALKPDVPKK